MREVLDAYRVLSSALENQLHTLEERCPNLRDYQSDYPAYQQAIEQYQRQRKAIQSARETIARAIFDLRRA